MTIHDAWWVLVFGGIGVIASIIFNAMRPEPTPGHYFGPMPDIVGMIGAVFIVMSSLIVGTLLWALDVTLTIG